MSTTFSQRWQPANLESWDWVFGQLPDKMTGNIVPAEIYDAMGIRVGPNLNVPDPARTRQLAAPTQPPPLLDNATSLQAAYDWFQGERARLEEYTSHQFAAIRANQQSDLARHYRSEEALIVRAQEVQREMQFLASQSKALQARANELAEWEKSLSVQMAKLTQAHEELLHIRQTSADVQRDTEAQQASLQQMRAEIAQLQSTEAAARTTFAGFDAALAERQQAWEKKQADLSARQAAMDRRYQALEQAEEAARRHLAELDDLEDRLREECEQQQRQLAVERQELQALYVALRGRR